MEGNGATIEEKPATLHLQSIRSSSRATMPRPSDPTHQTGFMGPVMPPGMYGYPPVMPMPWNYPGLGSGGVPLPACLPGQYFGTQPPMPTVDQTSASNMAPIVIPDVIAWFSYLDQHEERNKDNIIFAPYGIALKSKGFLRTYLSTHL